MDFKANFNQKVKYYNASKNHNKSLNSLYVHDYFD